MTSRLCAAMNAASAPSTLDCPSSASSSTSLSTPSVEMLIASLTFRLPNAVVIISSSTARFALTGVLASSASFSATTGGGHDLSTGESDPVAVLMPTQHRGPQAGGSERPQAFPTSFGRPLRRAVTVLTVTTRLAFRNVPNGYARNAFGERAEWVPVAVPGHLAPTGKAFPDCAPLTG